MVEKAVIEEEVENVDGKRVKNRKEHPHEKIIFHNHRNPSSFWKRIH